MPVDMDLSLYAVVDEEFLAGRDPAAVAAVLAANGASVVQYRAKRLASREFLKRARAVRDALAGSGVPFIVNDRLDIALLCGADGVHVGQDDVPVTDARIMMGPRVVIGVSVCTTAEAVSAEEDGADYLGAGAVFPTGTKTDAPLMGLDGLKAVRASVKLQVVAIGGLNKRNAAAALAAGADGLAFISELMCAGDPGAAARELRTIIDAAGRRRGLRKAGPTA
jgi:thiamine-phosphate pyrophosphorylase